MNSVEPEYLFGQFNPGDTVTVYGEHLDKLPDELCICFAPEKTSAENLYPTAKLGGLQAMPVLERDKNHITFYRSLDTSVQISVIEYPYYITTPYSEPRSIAYEI